MAIPFDGEALSWRHEGLTLEVELHREPLNEIGTLALRELEILARYLRSGGGGARVMSFTPTRKGFCAGADLRELHAGLMAQKSALDKTAAIAGVSSIAQDAGGTLHRAHSIGVGVLDAVPIATIAAVHGVCFGGGFELALACDRIVRIEPRGFAFPELRLGLVPGFGGIPRLERDVGNSVVRELLLTGRSVGGRRAHQIGLVAELVGRGEALNAARGRRRASSLASMAVRMAAAKGFAKPIPSERLRRERRVFCRLVTPARSAAASDRFC